MVLRQPERGETDPEVLQKNLTKPENSVASIEMHRTRQEMSAPRQTKEDEAPKAAQDGSELKDYVLFYVWREFKLLNSNLLLAIRGLPRKRRFWLGVSGIEYGYWRNSGRETG